MLAPSLSDKFIENPEPCSSIQVIGSFAMLIFFWFFICSLVWQCSQFSPPPHLLLDRLGILLLAKWLQLKSSYWWFCHFDIVHITLLSHNALVWQSCSLDWSLGRSEGERITPSVKLEASLLYIWEPATSKHYPAVQHSTIQHHPTIYFQHPAN